ncbi:MAG: VOC family protein [Chloroflexi bacterium]|nr:VOC family protein [Chloroflexota bacterium]
MISVDKFHHVAIIVRDLKRSRAFFEDVFGARFISEDYLDAEKRNAVFLALGGIIIELMQPTTSDSLTARFLERHGEGVHSIALRVDKYDKAIQQLEARGIRIAGRQADPPYAFTHPKDTFGTMIELSEYGWRRDPF